MFWKDKKVLVTGGAGFIGSNLIESLVKQGADVTSLDDYSTGTKDNHIEGANYIEGSTIDIEKKLKVVPQIIFHLGEYARVEKSFEDIEQVFRSNKLGTFAVLEYCRKNNVRIIYAGSSTKFADGGLGRDQSPYAWTKATNTELVRNYGVWFKISYAIAYFYNVYGPRERSDSFGTVIEIFHQRFLNNQPLLVVSPGTQTRNFTHVEDIVNGLVLIGEKGEGDDFGLGATESFSILDIANMFGTKIEMLAERSGNRMGSVIDISRSRNELGWSAKNNIRDYIEKIKKEK